MHAPVEIESHVRCVMLCDDSCTRVRGLDVAAAELRGLFHFLFLLRLLLLQVLMAGPGSINDNGLPFLTFKDVTAFCGLQ